MSILPLFGLEVRQGRRVYALQVLLGWGKTDDGPLSVYPPLGVLLLDPLLNALVQSNATTISATIVSALSNAGERG